ncbi:hypothetical protein QQX09_13815 [Demequina sp. SYSU T00192]|uniref:DUF2975 domain-containing protein n=1 Tax=Demequina litoralis TaxID=3051660 RepID=A0ABT8GCR6_9MICO|nr:hypothetical protein [Demequina sp. SYSU T00192]MDN4476931.1 hypothetical protein [Demequina sp. SYSU T00192]
MTQWSRLVAAGSLTVRIVLALGALLVVVSVPEQLRTWDDPSASVIPAERAMPKEANWLLGAVMLVTAFALVAGWIVRRTRAAENAGVVKAWRVVAWVTVAGMAAWIAVLAVSQWIAVQPSDAVIGMGAPGQLWDTVIALPAIVTLVIAGRDLRAVTRMKTPDDRAAEPAHRP